MTITEMNLAAAKETAILELESLIAQCHREIRNLGFNDERMLVATGDLQYHFDQVIEAAQELEDARDAAVWAEEEESN